MSIEKKKHFFYPRMSCFAATPTHRFQGKYLAALSIDDLLDGLISDAVVPSTKTK